jgi:cellulase/cellobiase CelA1
MLHAIRHPAAVVLLSALLAAPGLADDPPATPSANTPPAATGSQPTATPAAPATAAPAATASQPTPDPKSEATAKVTCREEKKTGSRLQKRQVCKTPGSESSSADWVREQQARGAIGAGAILNGQ